MRREVVIAGVVVIVAVWASVAFVMIGSPIPSDPEHTPPERPDGDEAQFENLVMMQDPVVQEFGAEQPPPIVEFVELETGHHLWPYYSSVPGSYEHRSAINLVIYGDGSMVVDLLVGEADWLETDPEEEGDAGVGTYGGDLDRPADDTPLAWGRADGTERFAYVEMDGHGYWLSETEQLHDGDYYGTRYHLRLYDIPPGGQAVAIQAHYEYFDWFTLRHTVTSVERAQLRVEADLMERLGHDRIWRQHAGNDGVYDSDGWVTFVVLGILSVVLLGQVESLQTRFARHAEPKFVSMLRERITAYHLGLFAAMVAIVLGVRFGGIAIEQLELVRIKWITVMLFPVLSLGVPVTAYLVSTRIDHRMDAAVTASVGLATAFLLDYTYLGITVIPIDLILHRTGLVLAIGFIAAGGAIRATTATRANGFAIVGTLVWIVLVAATLFAII